MDGLAVLESHDTQDALARLVWQGDLSPMADAPVRLRLAVQGIGYHGDTQVDRQIGPLAPDLLIEITGRDQPSSPIRSAAMNASCGIDTFPYSRIFAFPFFCFSSSLRLRVASPP